MIKPLETMPLISIIIANWNGGKIFEECLKSLSRLKYQKWELIVVDNGSVDTSFELLSNYKLIKNKTNLGFAKANNQGFKVSSGKYILLLNNDTKVNPDLLNVLVDKMEENLKVGALQPKIKLMDKKGYLDNAGTFLTRTGFLKHWGFMEKDGRRFNKEQLIFSAKGACLFTRSDLVKKIGLFDSDFGSYFEESDYCWRVWLSGFNVLYYPKTYILHKMGFTTRRQDVSFINYLSYRNRICSLLKNLGTFNLVSILGLHLFISLGISLVFLIKFQPKYSLMILKAILWNAIHLDETLKKRLKVQKMRVVKDEDLFKIFLRPFDLTKAFSDFQRIEEDLKRKLPR